MVVSHSPTSTLDEAVSQDGCLELLLKFAHRSFAVHPQSILLLERLLTCLSTLQSCPGLSREQSNNETDVHTSVGIPFPRPPDTFVESAMRQYSII